jgi:hypothetical protein
MYMFALKHMDGDRAITHFVDKTPRYISGMELANVIARAPAGVPIVVTRKSYASARASFVDKRNVSAAHFDKLYSGFEKRLARAQQSFPDRLFVVDTDALEGADRVAAEAVGRRLFAFLRLPFDSSYLKCTPNAPYGGGTRLFDGGGGDLQIACGSSGARWKGKTRDPKIGRRLLGCRFAGTPAHGALEQ